MQVIDLKYQDGIYNNNMNMNLLYGIFFFILAHIGAFIQLNGQFKRDWIVKNEWVVVWRNRNRTTQKYNIYKFLLKESNL